MFPNTLSFVIFIYSNRYSDIERGHQLKKKNIIQVLLLYIVLTAVTTIVLDEFSFRHSLFLLIDAILLTTGATLWEDTRLYYRGLAIPIVVLSSVFMIRFLTSAFLRVRDVNVYLSFCLALSNVILILTALIPKEVYRQIFVFISGAVLFFPVLLGWGFYAGEQSWLNVDAVMAILQTNMAEAIGYVQGRIGFYAFLIAAAYFLLLAVWGKTAARINVKTQSKRLSMGLVVFLLVNCAYAVRTGDNFVTVIGKDARSYQLNYDEYKRLVETRKQHLENSMLRSDTGKPGIYVLVIGESHNPKHMSSFGYQRKTTPWLDTMLHTANMLFFPHAYSCHVQTAQTLTYALTAKNQYNSMDLKEAVSLIDVAKAAGYKTVWLSNQVRFGGWDTPVTVIAEEADQKIWTNSHHGHTLDTDYYDGELVKRLHSISRSEKMLLVIHLIGSHAPYHYRYPVEYGKFRGNGERSEYDNSILYNDFVMKNILETVETWSGFKSLVYFSDHGEGIDSGKEHNSGSFVFDMACIPMYMYFSPAYQRESAEAFRTLRAAQTHYFTNDLIFNTMLGIMDIRNDAFYEAENDLTSAAYNGDVNRFKTLYGERNISEDADPYR